MKLVAIAVLVLCGTAHAENWLIDHSRLEVAYGTRLGSFLINNESNEKWMAGHIDFGLRRGRWWAYGEYELMGVDNGEDDRAIARGDASAPHFGDGLMHRVGGNVRYAYGHGPLDDIVNQLYVDVGLGLQHFRWDAGGYWTRPDLSLGLGAAIWGGSGKAHGSASIGLRVLISRRNDVPDDAPAVCGGPCDAATRPTGFDRSFMLDVTFGFGD